MGAETFVKQPAKEGGYSGGSRGGRTPADPFTMYMSYAKDLVVAHITAQTGDGSKMTLDDSVGATIQYANTLYEARPDAPEAVPKAVSEVFDSKEDPFGKDAIK